MTQTLRTIAAALEWLSEQTGRLVAWLTLLMVLVMVAIVALRYLFDSGSIALQESVSYLHATVFMLAAAYTLKHDAHVRVDIIYQHAGARVRAWINLTGTLLLLIPVCTFVLLASLDYVTASWSIREGSREAGGLDGVFLLKTLIPLMAVLLLLQGIAIVLRCILTLTDHNGTGQADSGMERER